MAIPTLIFCGGGNKRYAEIAISAGFEYGARLPGTVYYPLYFADQNWKHPNRKLYMDGLKKYRPIIASVLDWEQEEQLTEILDWATEAARYVHKIMIIPKVHGGIKFLPNKIDGKPVILGYSVPTKHGGTDLFLSEFVGWPVHLLGGSPRSQIRFSKYLNVVSADGNMAMLMANKYCAFFDDSFHGTCWPTLLDYDNKRWNGDGPYEAFRRSCENIRLYWEAQ